MRKIQIGIIMGSDSDLTVMSAAATILDEFAIPYELTIVSAHRTPQRMFNYAKEAQTRGLKIIIAGAGGAAHLPGMVAAITPLPVIGVPVRSKNICGLDSLYSIVQMPSGVPVATVAINGSKNAALLALKMLAISDRDVAKKVKQYMNKMEKEVLSKANKLEKIGFKDYIKEI